MKYLITAILLISGTVQGAILDITNQSGYEMRITRLHNSCDGLRITEDKPIYLKHGEGVILGNVTPVVQSIEVCGTGICVMSAIGMKDNITYTVDIVLDGGIIDYNVSPDHWTGTNTECPK